MLAWYFWLAPISSMKIRPSAVTTSARKAAARRRSKQVVVKRLLHIARQRPFVGITRMVQKRTEVLPYEVVEDRPLGATRFVVRTCEAERRRPRRRIAATYLRLALYQHGGASWRGLCQPWIVSFQVLGAGHPGGPRIPPWRRQVRGVVACCCRTEVTVTLDSVGLALPSRRGHEGGDTAGAPIMTGSAASAVRRQVRRETARQVLTEP